MMLRALFWVSSLLGPLTSSTHSAGAVGHPKDFFFGLIPKRS